MQYNGQANGPVLYPLDQDLSKTWFIKYPSPSGKGYLKKYGKLAAFHNIPDKLAEAERILREELSISDISFRQKMDPLMQLTEQFFSFKKTGLKKKSKTTYDTFLNEFARWYRLQGRFFPFEFIGLEFQKYLSEKGLTNTTNNNYRDCLRSVFSKMVKIKKLEINPFDATGKLDERRETKEWFRTEQLEIIQPVIEHEDPQLWLACSLQFYCFIRPDCELRNLMISDLEISERRIRIRAEFSKSGKYDEYVPIPGLLMQTLSQLCEKYPAHYLLFAKGGTPGIWPLSKANLYRRHKVFLNRLKFPSGYTFYSWKNSGAIHMFLNKISILDISEMMRHKSLDYTKEYFKSFGFSERAKDVDSKLPILGARTKA